MSGKIENPDAWTRQMTADILNSGVPEYYTDVKPVSNSLNTPRGKERMAAYLDAIREGAPMPIEGVNYPLSHAYDHGKPTSVNQ